MGKKLQTDIFKSIFVNYGRRKRGEGGGGGNGILETYFTFKMLNASKIL